MNSELQNQIDRARADIRTDAFSLSIGEWISIYEKGELDIHPEFQRFFRWSSRQKSRLIESLLLGIPIPQIFVSQRGDGVWDVVDGLQRLSTIYEAVGILRDENGETLPALRFEGTTYLPGLGGLRWDEGETESASLTQVQRLLIKRSKIDVSIILKESDDQIKFELFQRLNTGGSQLSDQEVRNSLLVMINRELFRWIKSLSQDACFLECTGLSDRAAEEQYDMELVLRFLILKGLSESELSNIGDIGEFLTERITSLAKQSDLKLAPEEESFHKTFNYLAQSLGSDCFRRYDQRKGKFTGGFSISAFEAVALGLVNNLDNMGSSGIEIVSKIKELWSQDEFTSNSGAGVTASRRISKIVPFARQYFRV